VFSALNLKVPVTVLIASFGDYNLALTNPNPVVYVVRPVAGLMVQTALLASPVPRK
jgi:hypothetical protein